MIKMKLQLYKKVVNDLDDVIYLNIYYYIITMFKNKLSPFIILFFNFLFILKIFFI